MEQQLKIREGFVEEALSSEYVSEHWDELVKRKHLFVLNPDYETYFTLQDNNKLLTLVIQDGDSIVGYSVNILNKNLHYADVIMCSNDLIYIHPSYRKGMLGIRLIKETEKLAKQKGAHIMYWHAKPDTNLAKLLPKMNAGLHEQIYLKEL